MCLMLTVAFAGVTLLVVQCNADDVRTEVTQILAGCSADISHANVV